MRNEDFEGYRELRSRSPIPIYFHHLPLQGREAMTAIHRLPQHYRTVLILVVVMGESYEDSARICRCKVGTVKSRVARGREMVIDRIDPDAR